MSKRGLSRRGWAGWALIEVMVLAVTSVPALAVDTSSPKAEPEGTTTPLPDPMGVTATRLAETLGIDVPLAREYLQRREHVGELYAQLRDSKPGGFEEMHIEYLPDYALVVLSTTGDLAAIMTFIISRGFEDLAPYVEVRRVSYTVDDLVTSIELLERVAGVPLVADGNVEDGTVWISTASESAKSVVETAAATTDLPIPSGQITVEAAGLIKAEANSFGGLNLDRQQNGPDECNTGFSVEETDGTGADGVVTAGHCFDYLEFNSGDDLNFVNDQESGSLDSQRHTTPGYDDQPWVRDGGTSHRVIDGRRARADQMKGDYVCVSKRDDTVKCGFLDSKIFDPGPGFNATFIRVDGGTTDLTVGGDSGSPWWVGSTIAYGTHVGSVDADPNDAVYMAQNYMTTLGVRVKVA